MGIVATSSKTIIDLQDGKTLSFYLETNNPKTQIYDVDTDSYVPNWESANLTVLPVLYANQNHVSNNSQQITTFRWYQGGTLIWEYANNQTTTNLPLPQGWSVNDGVTADRYKLTISNNTMGQNTGQMIIKALAVWVDPDTQGNQMVQTDITFSLIRNGGSVRRVQISGDQVFKYPVNQNNGNSEPSPASITLQALSQNIDTSNAWRWQYKNPGMAVFGDLNQLYNNDSSLISGDTAIIYAEPSSTIPTPFNTQSAAYDSVTIRAYRNNYSDVYDDFTLYKIKDGLTGAEGRPACIAFLQNESMSFPADMSGKLNSQIVYTCDIVAYKGLNPAKPYIEAVSNPTSSSATTVIVGPPGSISGVTIGNTGYIQTGVSGLTCTVSWQQGYENRVLLTLTGDSQTTFGGATHGQITIPITYIDTDSITLNLRLNWNKVCNGVDSVVMSLYAPDGSVFQNHEGDPKTINVSAYSGATDLTTLTGNAVNYVWEYYESGTWNRIDATYDINVNKVAIARDENSQIINHQLVVHPDFVPTQKTIRCTITYDSKQYSDTITMTDKTDNYLATIDSTGGEIFRNARGHSFLACRLWQNGLEADALKEAASADVLYVTDDSGPDQNAGNRGDFCYVCQKSVYRNGVLVAPKTVTLYKKTGETNWTTVSAAESHKKVYTWTRIGVDGTALDTEYPFAIGKVCYVDDTDVDRKCVFICEVSEVN